MNLAIQIGVGVVLAFLFILIARRKGRNTERFVYAVGLAIAASIYLLFAFLNHGTDHLMFEAMGLIVFTVVAAFGWKSWLILAIGWALHSGWDLWLHSKLSTPFVPDWYPGGCAGFDLFLAGYLFLIAFRSSNQKY